MRIRYDIKKLQQIINDLSTLTGMSLSFLDADSKRICKITPDTFNFCTYLQQNEALKNACAKSDLKVLAHCKKTGCFESHICHAGLFDAAMPIEKNGILAGIILMGRVRTPHLLNTPFEKDEKAKELYQKMPLLSDAQLASFKALLPDILFENAIYFEQESPADEAAEYIRGHLQEELSVTTLLKHFHISKNNLYRDFREKYGKTINQYVTDMRLEKAKELLKNETIPVYLVCEQVGIFNYTYFCKLFKKETGITPTEYRKRLQ